MSRRRAKFFRRGWVGRRWVWAGGTASPRLTSPVQLIFESVAANAWKSVHAGYRKVEQWNDAHPDLSRARATLTLDQWMQLVRVHRWCCAYCGRRPEVKYQSGLTMEHMVPLTRGGDHARENVVPACLPCNAQKANMTPLEWIAVQAGLWRNRVMRDHVRKRACA